MGEAEEAMGLWSDRNLISATVLAPAPLQFQVKLFQD